MIINLKKYLLYVLGNFKSKTFVEFKYGEDTKFSTYVSKSMWVGSHLAAIL